MYYVGRMFKLLVLLLALLFSLSSFSQSDTYFQKEFERIQQLANRLAGSPNNIPQRILHFKQIYNDSNSNFTFPIIAAHGALWAYNFFNKLAPFQNLNFLIPSRRINQTYESLSDFSYQLTTINRQVFIDIYTYYHFTKLFYENESAKIFFLNRTTTKAESLWNALRQVHIAKESGVAISDSLKLEIYKIALYFEQYSMVGEKVTKAFACLKVASPMKQLAVMPNVKFKYFPPLIRFQFLNFVNTEERIYWALEAYRIAQEVGFETVANTL